MKSKTVASLAIVLTAALLAMPAVADDIVRVKATIDSFDGATLRVTTDDGTSVSVAMLPTAVILYDAKKSVADIRKGDFVGVASARDADGKLHAIEIHIFPDGMRGQGEGHYPMGSDESRTMTDATVTGVAEAARGGTLTVHYRGAAMADGVCAGRAPLPPPAWQSPPPPDADSGCSGDAEIAIAPGVPVVALVPGDKILLVAGAAVLMFVTTGPDGKKATPGLSVEKDGFVPLI